MRTAALRVRVVAPLSHEKAASEAAEGVQVAHEAAPARSCNPRSLSQALSRQALPQLRNWQSLSRNIT